MFESEEMKAARFLANEYFMTNLIFRMWDRMRLRKAKKVQQVRERVQNDEPFMAAYYRSQHQKKHKRKLP